MQAVPVQRANVAFSRTGSDSRDAVLSSLYSTGNGVVASAEAGFGPAAWLGSRALEQAWVDLPPNLEAIVREMGKQLLSDPR